MSASDARVAAPAPAARPRREPMRLLERYGLLLIWLALIAAFAVLRPEVFLQWNTVSLILGSQAVLVVLALALMVPLVAGDFDLSVAATMTLAAMVLAILTRHLGLPLPLALAGVLAASVAVGAVNALFIIAFDVNSLIVTLGTGTFLGGVVLWISNSQTISGVARPLVRFVVGTRLLGIPMAFYCGLLLCALVWYVLARTGLGLRVLFVGRNREVARLSGIRVGAIRLGCLLASSVGAGIAGVIYVGTSGAADPSSGLSYLLPAFAAVFLGSTCLTPGRFNAFGTMAAVYFLMTGITGLTMMGIQTYVQNLFYGGALVLAVTLSQLAARRRGA